MQVVGGPQEERSRRLMRDPMMDAPTKEREFVVPVDFRMQEETYQEKFAAQHEEITFLKTYIEKLLNQLRRVLVKHNELEQLQTLCDPTTTHVADDGEDSMTPPPWFTSKEYMSPLFAAYEGRIKELESTCDKHRKDLDAFVVHATSLTSDNDRLNQELTTALEKLIMHAEAPSSGGRGSSDFFATSTPVDSTADQLAEMNERLDFLMSVRGREIYATACAHLKQENNLLAEQRSLVETELDECQRDIHDRDDQLLAMSHNFNQATVAIQELRDSCDHLKLEKQKCEVQVQQFAATIAQLEAQKETIAGRVTGLQANVATYLVRVFIQILGRAPGGSFSFETAPFKLTMEMVECMGGKDSANFKTFTDLCIQAAVAARRHGETLYTLVEVMSFHSKLPCFSGIIISKMLLLTTFFSAFVTNVVILGNVTATLQAFRDRLFLNVPEDKVGRVVEGLIHKAFDNFGTAKYDQFQEYSNGIAK
ncbi:hypothetical protein DYB31_002176 [Aphanomyces astaci]|uniref:PI3K/PI4K catalytic domain-containing protein n=2 Tax=Aphanomyces astaci TaxID=112090 RepID=A0A397FZ91_APHAT|nr:hypothetical protein DYB31_002176 [Aphanomyces astaci]